MSELFAMLSVGWAWIVAAAGALIAVYFGGKKIGSTQAQAKADVVAAEKSKAESDAVAKQQAEYAEKAKDVKDENASVSDDAARDRLRQSKYNQP